MFLIKNVQILKIFCIQAHTNVFRSFGKCLKRFLTYLYCTKCYEINICYLGIHKHISYLKKCPEYHKYFAEMQTQNFSDRIRKNLNVSWHINIAQNIMKFTRNSDMQACFLWKWHKCHKHFAYILTHRFPIH